LYVGVATKVIASDVPTTWGLAEFQAKNNPSVRGYLPLG
jgi:hypothetical protein